MTGPERPGLRLPLGVEVAAGVWLIVATAVFGPSLSLAATGPAWNELGCGVAVAIVALLRWHSPRGAPWAGVLNVALGAWLVAAALVIGRPAADQPEFARLGELIAGIAVAVVSAISVTIARRTGRSPGSGVRGD